MILNTLSIIAIRARLIELRYQVRELTSLQNEAAATDENDELVLERLLDEIAFLQRLIGH